MVHNTDFRAPWLLAGAACLVVVWLGISLGGDRKKTSDQGSKGTALKADDVRRSLSNRDLEPVRSLAGEPMEERLALESGPDQEDASSQELLDDPFGFEGPDYLRFVTLAGEPISGLGVSAAVNVSHHFHEPPTDELGRVPVMKPSVGREYHYWPLFGSSKPIPLAQLPIVGDCYQFATDDIGAYRIEVLGADGLPLRERPAVIVRQVAREGDQIERESEQATRTLGSRDLNRVLVSRSDGQLEVAFLGGNGERSIPRDRAPALEFHPLPEPGSPTAPRLVLLEPNRVGFDLRGRVDLSAASAAVSASGQGPRRAAFVLETDRGLSGVSGDVDEEGRFQVRFLSAGSVAFRFTLYLLPEREPSPGYGRFASEFGSGLHPGIADLGFLTPATLPRICRVRLSRPQKTNYPPLILFQPDPDQEFAETLEFGYLRISDQGWEARRSSLKGERWVEFFGRRPGPKTFVGVTRDRQAGYREELTMPDEPLLVPPGDSELTLPFGLIVDAGFRIEGLPDATDAVRVSAQRVGGEGLEQVLGQCGLGLHFLNLTVGDFLLRFYDLESGDLLKSVRASLPEEASRIGSRTLYLDGAAEALDAKGTRVGSSFMPNEWSSLRLVGLD